MAEPNDETRAGMPADAPRKPFTPPEVEELGRLSELTQQTFGGPIG